MNLKFYWILNFRLCIFRKFRYLGLINSFKALKLTETETWHTSETGFKTF